MKLLLAIAMMNPCEVVFDNVQEYETLSIWVTAIDENTMRPGGGGPTRYFWIYRVPESVTVVTCEELGLYDHGDLVYTVQKIRDEPNPDNTATFYRRNWGELIEYSISVSIRPDPPILEDAI